MYIRRRPGLHDPTSCSFSQDGSQVLISCLNDGMYTFNVPKSGSVVVHDSKRGREKRSIFDTPLCTDVPRCFEEKYRENLGSGRYYPAELVSVMLSFVKKDESTRVSFLLFTASVALHIFHPSSQRLMGGAKWLI